MNDAVPDAPWITGVRDALLRHYDAHARSLPWRGSGDPYTVLVSEVMLQQTRVHAVLPYYERWLQRFPDIDTLADAPVDDVLKHWEGLGYYSRARNLHHTARILRERHHGTIPADYDTLRSLPGIGEYTAGAVSSIAYGVRRPAIDGNVRRVLARLLDDPAPTTARLRSCAAALVPAERPGDFNQALMDLGATICSPRNPDCRACPLSAHCAAFRAGTQLDRPRARRRARPPLFLIATAVITTDGSDGVLLVQRPPGGLLARMWCLPGREVTAAAAAGPAALALARELLGERARLRATALGSVDHSFSHRRERYQCYQLRCAAPPPRLPDPARWVSPMTSDVAIPRAQRKILSLVRP